MKRRDTKTQSLAEVFVATVLARAKTFSFFHRDDILEADEESESSESEGELLEIMGRRSTKHYATRFNNEQLVQKVNEEADQRRQITEKLALKFQGKVLESMKKKGGDRADASALQGMEEKLRGLVTIP